MSFSVLLTRRGTHKSLAGGVVLGVVAWALLAVQIAEFLSAPPDLFAVIVLLAIPAMLSVTLFIGGIGIYLYDLDDLALRISAWTILGLAMFSLILGGELLYLEPQLDTGLQSSVLLVNVAAGGAVLGFIVGIYDARQHLLHQELREEYNHTIGLSQRLSVLSRILRHDLRNHLNVIIGQAESLQKQSDDPADTEAMKAIQRAGHELETISDTIGRFSTILANPQPDQTVKKIDITRSVSEAIESVKNHHNAPADSFEVIAPESVVITASPFLNQAITELVDNAIVHNDSDTPLVIIEINEFADSNEGIELRITDNGPGIPSEEIRVHNKDIETQLDHSLGVGLWLVHWVVTASDGELSFDTHTASGTTIQLFFPNHE